MTELTGEPQVCPDWFIAEPNTDDVDRALGDGERLHEWICGLANRRERHGLVRCESNQGAEIIEGAFRSPPAAVTTFVPAPPAVAA